MGTKKGQRRKTARRAYEKSSATRYAYKVKIPGERRFIRTQTRKITGPEVSSMLKQGWKIERLW